MQFLLKSEKKNQYIIIAGSGDLNYDGACILKSAFTNFFDAGERRFILNFEGLRIISSHSLSIILKFSTTVRQNGGIIKMICPKGNVRDVFYVLEISKVIPIYGSEKELWEIEKELTSKNNFDI